MLLETDCPIYIINLKHKEKDLIRCLREIRKLDIFKNIIITEAVNKEEAFVLSYASITKQAYNNIEVSLKSIDVLPTWGSVGCALSHKKCWEDIVKKNLKYGIICEDDTKITNISNFKYAFYNCLNKTIKHSNKYSNGCFTTFNSKINKTLSYDNKIMGVFTGTSFYMIDNNCAKKLISLFPITNQIDVEIGLNKESINLFNIPTNESGVGNYDHISSVQYHFIELKALINCLNKILPTELIEIIYNFLPKKNRLINNYGGYYGYGGYGGYGGYSGHIIN